jgi:hypothetical protein
VKVSVPKTPSEDKTEDPGGQISSESSRHSFFSICLNYNFLFESASWFFLDYAILGAYYNLLLSILDLQV